MTPEASPKRLYLALFFPLLSANRWQREQGAADTPLVFTEKQRGALRIVAADKQALSLGIGPGLGLADARARVPDLLAVDHDPAADARLLAWLAAGCERYTPSVAIDGQDGLILDITGCVHLWDGETALVTDLADRIGRLGLTLRHALAHTPDRARALARHGKNLPIAALDLDEDAAIALRRAGLYSVAEVAKRPRAALAARFGKAMVFKLARVLGEEDSRITPRRAPPAIFALRRFAEPIARTDYILETIAELVREASETLRERGAGGRRFAIRLFRSDGDVRALAVETGGPTRNAALLLRLFRERIDSLADPLDPGFGYDAVRLDVERAEALAPTQIASEGQRTQAEDPHALIDRLGVRFGQNRVRRFVSGNSHIPELAGLTLPAAAPSLPFDWPRTEAGEPPLRPLHLFDPPQRIEVMAEVPDGPPRQFRWRRDIHKVLLAEGPERIASEWWKRRGGYEPGKGGLTRDYFRVEDAGGRRFWLFRHGLYGEEKQPDWYLHGLFA